MAVNTRRNRARGLTGDGVLAAIIGEPDRAPTSPSLSAPEGGEEYHRPVHATLPNAKDNH
jgi:hypothetical protein